MYIPIFYVRLRIRKLEHFMGKIKYWQAVLTVTAGVAAFSTLMVFLDPRVSDYTLQRKVLTVLVLTLIMPIIGIVSWFGGSLMFAISDMLHSEKNSKDTKTTD